MKAAELLTFSSAKSVVTLLSVLIPRLWPDFFQFCYSVHYCFTTKKKKRSVFLCYVSSFITFLPYYFHINISTYIFLPSTLLDTYLLPFGLCVLILFKKRRDLRVSRNTHIIQKYRIEIGNNFF